MGELAHVQLAKEDSPGLFEVGDYSGVEFGDEIRPDFGGVGGGPPAPGIHRVLDAHWEAVEGTPVLAAANLSFGLQGFSPSLFGADGDIGVDLGIDALDAVQVGFHGLDGGDLLGLDGGTQFRG